jgi:hypothetical protein
MLPSDHMQDYLVPDWLKFQTAICFKKRKHFCIFPVSVRKFRTRAESSSLDGKVTVSGGKFQAREEKVSLYGKGIITVSGRKFQAREEKVSLYGKGIITVSGRKFQSGWESYGLGRKVHGAGRESSNLDGKVTVSGGKFQALPLDNYPGRLRRRQVVGLFHCLSGLEFSGIILAVY